MNGITTSIRIEIPNISEEIDEIIHDRMMRPQMSAMHSAYNFIRDGVDKKSAWKMLRIRYPWLTGRNVNDAIVMANGIYRSQQELLSEHLLNVKKRIEKAEIRLKKVDDVHLERAVFNKIANLKLQEKKLNDHIRMGTVPSIKFGGQRRWDRVCRKLPDAKSDWGFSRSNQFFSRGAKNYHGNPHVRLILDGDENLSLSVRVPVEIKYGKRITTSAEWKEFPISYSEMYFQLLKQAAIDGAKGAGQYSVRIIRISNSHYRAYITLEEAVVYRELDTFEEMPDTGNFVAGVDLNLDHLAVVVVDRQGQYIKSKLFRYPNLGELRKEKTKWQIGNISREVICWAQSQGAAAIVIENLKINSGNGSNVQNRRTVPFAYRKLGEMLSRRALREGLYVKRVHPAYSSWIGYLKYSKMYGLSVHMSAAYVIARRGLGLQERLPKSLIKIIPKVIDILERGETLERKEKWIERLKNWKSYSPENGKPWLLWATLYSSSEYSREVRKIVTYGRN